MSSEYKLGLTLSSQSEKLGVTTTVKEQVENIEMTLDHFKMTVDSQRKLQHQLQMQINKLEEKTRGDFEAMLKEIADHSAYLTETFKTGNEKQSKEFEYLELQSNILTEEHAKLHELSSGVMTRTAEVESNVGL